MAKYNVGNLLQHFVALRATAAFIKTLGECEGVEVEYVDPFSMEDWETNEKPNPANAQFSRIVQSLYHKAENGDFVATTFMAAWRQRYGESPIPVNSLQRDYPNTANLLCHAFPEVRWKMKLHDIDEEKRNRLIEWANMRHNVECRVGSEWHESSLILKAPIANDVPAIVMLDPDKIVRSEETAQKNKAVLTDGDLRFMMGSLCLNLLKRPSHSAGAHAMVIALSYSDSAPHIADEIVRQQFEVNNWKIQRIVSGPHRVYKNNSFHQAWVITSSWNLELDLQNEWNQWSEWFPSNSSGEVDVAS